MPTHVTITCPSGLRVHVTPGADGPPLLLVHGQLGDHEVWRGTVAHVAGRCRVAAVDLPGHGASRDVEVVDIAALDRAVLEATGALGWGPVVAVGHSLGATALVRAALARPASFRGLLLAALPPGEVPEAKRRWFHGLADAMGAALPETFAAQGAELWYSPGHRAAHPALTAELARRLAKNAPAAARAVLRAVADQPALRPSTPLPLPTVVLAMDEDTATPFEVSRPLAEALGATVARLPGGHFPFEEVPARFFAELDRLLERCSSGQ